MLLEIKDFGPIGHCTIEFGDLTVFIGPQASGKSLAASIFKYCLDRQHFRKILKQQNFRLQADAEDNMDLYFGEGGRHLWSRGTRITYNRISLPKSDFEPPKQGEQYSRAKENVFYVPAQRILGFVNSWPRNFSDFGADTNYCLRHFSESLRQDLELPGNTGLGGDIIFPIERRLKMEIRERFSREVYAGKSIVQDKSIRKRFLLEVSSGTRLPFLTWSAGQKEFLPLLLAFLRLCPGATTSRYANVKYVVLEEPEMGLHPTAVAATMLQILDLLARGYRVIITTHSQEYLYLAWFLRQLGKIKASNDKKLTALIRLFGTEKAQNLNRMLKTALEKEVRSYFFHRDTSTTVSDISELDPASPDEHQASWGGLTNFGGQAIDLLLELENFKDG